MLMRALLFLAGVVGLQQAASLAQGLGLLSAALLAGAVSDRGRGHVWCLAAGIFWALLFAFVHLQQRLPATLEGRPLAVRGYIADLPACDGRACRFDFETVSADQGVPPRLRLSWYNPPPALAAGQHWSLTVKLKQPHGLLNPGGFDYERRLFMAGIGATGYVRGYPAPVLLPAPRPPGMAALRQFLSDKLSECCSNLPEIGLIKALTLGDDRAVSQAEWELFRLTGTTHLMVISGSHIGLIAGLTYWAARRLWARTGRPTPAPPQFAAGAAIAAAIGYSALAGFSVPTVRAAAMLTVAMTAVIWQRNSRPLNILALALLVILLTDPLAVLAPGFWLSFAAVGIILYLTGGRAGKPGYWSALLKINGVVALALTPLLAVFFRQISVIAPVANVVAAPVVSLIVVPLGLPAVLLSLGFGSASQALLWPAAQILRHLLDFLTWLALVPNASPTLPEPSAAALALAVPAVFLLLAPAGIPARWLGIPLMLPLLFPLTERLDGGEVKLTLLDVGQGLASVVQTANHTLVFDTGAKFASGRDAGASVLLPFLQSRGIRRVDLLMVSHGDNDHIGGAASLLSGMPVDRIITGVPDRLAQYVPAACADGQSWQWDQVGFAVLAPPARRFPGSNNNSCVLKVTGRYGSLLLPGDIEAQAESWLAATKPNRLAADVLIAPHHGSNSSSTPEFLAAVNPALVLISAGYQNQFGHPHPSALERYHTINAAVLNTAAEGAIAVALTRGGVKVSGWRRDSRRYWHH